MDHRSHNRKRNASHGQALVPVIFVMLILMTLAITFATSVHREIRASVNFDTQTQRYFAAQGAVNYAMSALAQTSNNGATYGIIPQSAAADANGWMQIGDAWVKIDAMDTAGLINLNTVTLTTLNQIPVLQQNPDVVAAIIDWRTPSTQPSANGAKSEYYNTLTPSYDCKNGPYDSVEELLLVKGVTPTLLYGTSAGSAVDPVAIATQNSASVPGGPSRAAPTRQAGSQGPPITARPGGLSGGNGQGPPIRARPGGLGGGNSQGPPISARPGGLGGGNGQGPPITARPGGTGGTGSGGPGGLPGSGGTGTTGSTAPVGDTDWTDVYNASTLPLSEIFTTLSWERNVAADGTARININTATAADLTGIGMAQNLANGLVRFRTSGTTGTTGAPNGGPGGGTGRPGGTTPPPAPRINSRSTGSLPNFAPGRQASGAPGSSRPGGAGAGGTTPGGGGGGGTTPGGAPPGGTGTTGGGASATTFKTLADLLTVQGFTQPVLQQIADKLSVDDKAYHADLVNINTASQEALAAVPGMDHTTLQAIVAYRQGGKAFQNVGDFFALQGLTRQQFQNVVAHLCTKSSFYRVRVRIRMPGQDSLYAVTALVQLTENGPQILQWKEAQRSPGWALWTASPSLPTPTASSTGSASSSTSP